MWSLFLKDGKYLSMHRVLKYLISLMLKIVLYLVGRGRANTAYIHIHIYIYTYKKIKRKRSCLAYDTWRNGHQIQGAKWCILWGNKSQH